MNRTLIVMFLAQMFALTGVPVVILLGGLVGAKMAPTPALATLPVSLSIIGIAVSTIPAALFMARFGRRAGFLTGAGYACLAGIIAASAIAMENFWLFCAATFLIGSNNAFVQQIRFAVAESTTEDKVPSYLATLMLAGVVAAYIGPETARQLHDWSNWGQYSGSFLGVSLLMAISFVLLSFYKNGQREIQPVRSEDHRSISSVLRQPVFLLAVAAAASGYTVMSLVMTATPISMHIHDHFSLEDTTWVIQSHIMAMYLPSLFSGYLIARLGPRQIIGWGMLILTACLIIAWQEMALMHYWWALVLLGIGWNFLFLGGTTLLTGTYRDSERFQVQAINDFAIFSMQAGAALGSGFILSQLGWQWVVGLSLPFLACLLPLLWITRR